jgi:hypothetical protein
MGVNEQGSLVSRKRRAAGDRPQPTDPRIWLRLGVIGAVMLLGGLALAIGSAGYMWQLAEKADRLRAEGVPVAASVSGFYNASGRGGGVDTIDVAYHYQGEYYQARIKCGGLTGCHSTPSAQTTVWIDPADPAQFVAENGHTDNSVSFLNGFTPIPTGVAFALLGVVGLVVARIGSKDHARLRKENHGDA